MSVGSEWDLSKIKESLNYTNRILERMVEAIEKIASIEEKILDNQTAILRIQEHIMNTTLEQRDIVERWIEKIEAKERNVTSTEDDKL